MSGHTPGPWEVRPFTNSFGICNPNINRNYQSRIAECDYWRDGGNGPKQQPDKPTAEANARLIAAAPELLEALTNIFNGLDTGGIRIETDQDEIWANAVQKARTAIAKAKGE